MTEEASIKIYSDGGSRGNPGPSAAAFVVINNGRIIHKEKKFLGTRTNNEAEYEGVRMAISWLENNQDNLKVKRLKYFLDSQLVVRQLNGQYKVKSEKLKPIINDIRKRMNNLECMVSFRSLPREQNKLSDKLVNEALDEQAN